MEINIGIIAIIVLAIAILAILASGYVKAKTGDTTTAKVYDDWYKAVYLPAVEPETPAPASFAMNQETGKAAEVKSMAKAVADK